MYNPSSASRGGASSPTQPSLLDNLVENITVSAAHGKTVQCKCPSVKIRVDPWLLPSDTWCPLCASWFLPSLIQTTGHAVRQACRFVRSSPPAPPQNPQVRVPTPQVPFPTAKVTFPSPQVALNLSPFQPPTIFIKPSTPTTYAVPQEKKDSPLEPFPRPSGDAQHAYAGWRCLGSGRRVSVGGGGVSSA